MARKSEIIAHGRGYFTGFSHGLIVSAVIGFVLKVKGYV